MTENRTILILGHGEMGKAMEALLNKRHALHIWQRHPPSGSEVVDLEQAVSMAGFVFFCLPAMPVFALASRIAPQLNKDTVCLSIAKGLDDEARPAALAMRDALGTTCQQAVIYGPMISEELRAGHPGFADVGTKVPETCDTIRALFDGTALYLRCNGDIDGLSWSAVMKNVYALAFGMSDELQLGDNVRGLLATIALGELSAISQAFGGQADTPYGLAGLGDLITTATSPDSHHHETGRLLARGVREGLGGEGLHTLSLVRERGLIAPGIYPLFDTIGHVVDGELDARAGLEQVFQAVRKGP